MSCISHAHVLSVKFSLFQSVTLCLSSKVCVSVYKMHRMPSMWGCIQCFELQGSFCKRGSSKTRMNICNTLQHTATHCTTLHHTATHLKRGSSKTRMNICNALNLLNGSIYMYTFYPSTTEDTQPRSAPQVQQAAASEWASAPYPTFLKMIFFCFCFFGPPSHLPPPS